MAERIYLGVNSDGESISLKKHKWDCGWYWSFGYVGNRNLHYHIDSMINHPSHYDDKWTNVTRQFRETWLTQDQWWILRDLFITAYALKKAAECYRCGGHQTHKARDHHVVSADMATLLNADLKICLDNIWVLLLKWREDFLENRIEQKQIHESGI